MRNLTSLSIFCFGLVCCLLELLPFLLSAQLLTSSPVSCSEHICLLIFFWIATSSGKFYVSFKTSSSDSNYFWACPIYYVNFLLCFPFSLLFALPFLGELLCPFLVHFFFVFCPFQPLEKNKSHRAIYSIYLHNVVSPIWSLCCWFLFFEFNNFQTFWIALSAMYCHVCAIWCYYYNNLQLLTSQNEDLASLNVNRHTKTSLEKERIQNSSALNNLVFCEVVGFCYHC